MASRDLPLSRTDGRTDKCKISIMIARVAMDLWQRKPTLSSGYALGLGRFTAINPWLPCYNYYIDAEAKGSTVFTILTTPFCDARVQRGRRDSKLTIDPIGRGELSYLEIYYDDRTYK